MYRGKLNICLSMVAVGGREIFRLRDSGRATWPRCCIPCCVYDVLFDALT